MINRLGSLARPLLRALAPETAHRLAIGALRALPAPPIQGDDPGLAVEVFGLRFPNPIGLAAGFDKNATAPDALLGLGFGFVEIGTVTAKPQLGNPRPRVFRLDADGALINRLGFNSKGQADVHLRLARRRAQCGIIAVNIGANKDRADRAADYVSGVEMFADVADFLVVNISSPNTPGLRDLQRGAALGELLALVLGARDRMAARHGVRPVLVKIDPDLTLAELDAIIAVARARRIDGMVIANTTVARPASLADRAKAGEPGGLSGRPLFSPSTRMLAESFLRVGGQFPLVGVGGVDSPDAAYAKIKAGSSLVELYTGLVFKGPGLIGQIKRGLVTQLARDGYARLADAVGADAADWAAGKVAATSA